jgi:hypothetical protein
MESKEPRQINQFKAMDEHGNDYTVVEYQNVTQTRSLKWRSMEKCHEDAFHRPDLGNPHCRSGFY